MIYNGINFNGTHYTGTDFELWCNFYDLSRYLYIGERLLCLVKPAQAGKKVIATIENPNISASYAPDSSGYVVLDLTDIARTYGDIGAASLIQVEDGTDDYEVFASYSYVRLLDPDTILKPYYPEYESDASLAPPRKLIEPFTNGSLKIICELQYPTGDDWYIVTRPTLSSSLITGDSFEVTRAQKNFFIYTDSYSTLDYERSLTPQVCGRTYAAVRWRSCTGVTRQHFFEVVKRNISAGEKISLLRLDNAPIISNGREDGFSLRIDDLCAYDIWYYGDLITSGLVEVSLDGANWQRVEVETSSVQIPDGESGTDGKLEIKVIYKRYDAVVM